MPAAPDQVSPVIATVIVVNWNGAHLLPACLDAVRAQQLPGREVGAGFRVVVVDNGSVDGSRELLARQYPDVECLLSPVNLGFAGGNNLALRALRTPFAVLLNNDSEPQSGWLAGVLEPLQRDARLAAVTPLVLFRDGAHEGERTVNNAGVVVFRDGYGADRGFGDPAEKFGNAEEVFGFCGNGVALRASALAQVGSFDENFFLYYEDTDLSWRLRLCGWSIRFEPRAVVWHRHSASSGLGSPLFRFHNERNRLLMLTKNATTGLALRAALRFPLSTASIAVDELRRARTDRRKPSVELIATRVRSFASFLRLLPAAVRERRRIAELAVLSRADVEQQWLTAS